MRFISTFSSLLLLTSRRTPFALSKCLYSSSSLSLSTSSFTVSAFPNNNMSCCPANAAKYHAPDYNVQGEVKTEGSLEFYASPFPENTNKGVLLIPDIYGWNGGRTRKIADYFASNGYYTIVPRFLTPAINGGTDGDGFPDNYEFSNFMVDIKNYPYEQHLKPIVEQSIAYFKSQGIEKISVIGFCWGGWVITHIFSTDLANEFQCGAIPHPSVHLEKVAWGNDVLELFKKVRLPIYLLPARGDPANYHEDGDWFKALHANNPTSKTITYHDVDHGFSCRGDMNDPAVSAATLDCFSKVVKFFNDHNH